MSKISNKKTVIKTDSKFIDVSNKKKPESTSFFTSSIFYKILLFCGAILLFGWTKSFDYGIDDKFILSPINNIDNDFSGFISIFKMWFAGADYRPISFISFWLERKFSGNLTPGLSHFVNVFLFGFILIKIYDFIIVSKFYNDEVKLKQLAIFCCVLFLVHPNHVSIVANIKARDNLLSMFFGLCAAIEIIKYYDYKKPIRVILFLFFITCAFLSKIDSYTFVVVPMLVILFFRDYDKKKIIKYATLSLALAIAAFIIFACFKTLLNNDKYIFSMGFDENPIIGHNTFINRLSLTATTLFYYLKFLVIPTGYYFFFGYNQIPLTSFFSIINITALVTLIVLVFLSIKIFSKNRIYLFSLLFFLGSIFYALNFYVEVAGIVMDKYNFIASLGFCIAVASLFIDYFKTRQKTIAFLILTIFYASFTIYRTNDWRNSFTIIERDMPYLTNSVNANRMAAAAYINKALDEEMKPNYNRDFTDSLINIGDKYATQGLNVYNKVPDLLELKGLTFFYKKELVSRLYLSHNIQIVSRW